MSRKKIIISEEDLKKLYYQEKKSKYKIGAIYGCSFKTVLNRMREFGMEPLSRSIIQSKYDKQNFLGDLLEKAYLIGFRLGDLNVYQTNSKSDVIVVRCHTTQLVQVELLKDIFRDYGRISVSLNARGSYHINCFLNKSFDFLLPKKNRVELWIGKNIDCSLAFLAGYIDAEGNLGVYDGRARFKIDSYDKGIIHWIYNFFSKNNIFCPKPQKIGDKNQVYNKRLGYKYNKELWRIRVSQSKSLEKMLCLVRPYLKHKTRIKHLDKCLLNIHERNKK